MCVVWHRRDVLLLVVSSGRPCVITAVGRYFYSGGKSKVPFLHNIIRLCQINVNLEQFSGTKPRYVQFTQHLQPSHESNRIAVS
jgi:hypothetical protein